MRSLVRLSLWIIPFSAWPVPAVSLQAADAPEFLPALDSEPRGLLTGLRTTTVLLDELETGIWAMGETYKAGFRPEGATFVPFFGSDEPRNWPVGLRVCALRVGARELAFERWVAPVREGTSVRFDRGALVERYDLELEHMEQTFLLRERGGSGALVLELELETDLELAEEGRDLLFLGERGHVRYSGAIAIDARGERVLAPTRLEGGRIRIELDAADHDRLRYPLLIDPVLSVFQITPNQVPNGINPDVLSRPGQDFALVFERSFSAGDSDVFFMLLDLSGAWMWEGTVDISTENWTFPSVGRGRGFLVAASVGPVGSRTIRSRLKYDWDFQFLASNYVGGASNSDALYPVIGGDRHDNLERDFCVVWQRVLQSGQSVVEARMVRGNGLAFGNPILTVAANTGTSEAAPSIATWSSSSPGALGEWVVAWHRWTLSNSDLYMRRIHADGTLVGGTIALDTTITDTRFPRVSSPTRGPVPRTLITYSRGSVANSRSWGYVLSGGSVVQQVNLSALTGAAPDRRQIFPCAEAYRDSFVFLECEQFPSSSLYGVYLSTLAWIDDRLHVAESRRSVGASGQTVGVPRLGVPHSFGPVLAVWTWEGFQPQPTLFGSLYQPVDHASFCEPGTPGILACPCGNAPSGPGRGCDNASHTGGASLTGVGTAFPENLILTVSGMRPTSVALLVQGSQVGVDAPFGDGVRCVYGTLLRMGVRTAVAGQASWPATNEPSLRTLSSMKGDPIPFGDSRYYFVYYRDPEPGWACAGEFNTSNALRVNY